MKKAFAACVATVYDRWGKRRAFFVDLAGLVLMAGLIAMWFHPTFPYLFWLVAMILSACDRMISSERSVDPRKLFFPPVYIANRLDGRAAKVVTIILSAGWLLGTISMMILGRYSHAIADMRALAMVAWMMIVGFVLFLKSKDLFTFDSRGASGEKKNNEGQAGFPPPPPPPPHFCQDCGSPVRDEDGTLKCGGCGQRYRMVNGNPVKVEAEDTTPKLPDAPDTPCTYCQGWLVPSSKGSYCGMCGRPYGPNGELLPESVEPPANFLRAGQKHRNCSLCGGRLHHERESIGCTMCRTKYREVDHKLVKLEPKKLEFKNIDICIRCGSQMRNSTPTTAECTECGSEFDRVSGREILRSNRATSIYQVPGTPVATAPVSSVGGGGKSDTGFWFWNLTYRAKYRRTQWMFAVAFVLMLIPPTALIGLIGVLAGIIQLIYYRGKAIEEEKGESRQMQPARSRPANRRGPKEDSVKKGAGGCVWGLAWFVILFVAIGIASEHPIAGGVLVGLVIGVPLGAFVVRTATSSVCGFTPPFKMAANAVVMGFGATVATNFAVGFVCGASGKAMGTTALSIALIISVLAQSVIYGAIIRNEDDWPVGMGSGFVIQLVQTAMVCVVMYLVLLMAGVSVSDVLKASTMKSGGGYMDDFTRTHGVLRGIVTRARVGNGLAGFERDIVDASSTVSAFTSMYESQPDEWRKKHVSGSFLCMAWKHLGDAREDWIRVANLTGSDFPKAQNLRWDFEESRDESIDSVDMALDLALEAIEDGDDKDAVVKMIKDDSGGDGKADSKESFTNVDHRIDVATKQYAGFMILVAVGLVLTLVVVSKSLS